MEKSGIEKLRLAWQFCSINGLKGATIVIDSKDQLQVAGGDQIQFFILNNTHLETHRGGYFRSLREKIRSLA
jgi:hypothetical protein